MGALLPHAIQSLITGGHALGIGAKNLSATLKNSILDAITRSSEKGIANTPEATAKNIETNFRAAWRMLAIEDFGPLDVTPNLHPVAIRVSAMLLRIGAG